MLIKVFVKHDRGQRVTFRCENNREVQFYPRAHRLPASRRVCDPQPVCQGRSLCSCLPATRGHGHLARPLRASCSRNFLPEGKSHAALTTRPRTHTRPGAHRQPQARLTWHRAEAGAVGHPGRPHASAPGPMGDTRAFPAPHAPSCFKVSGRRKLSEAPPRRWGGRRGRWALPSARPQRLTPA